MYSKSHGVKRKQSFKKARRNKEIFISLSKILDEKPKKNHTDIGRFKKSANIDSKKSKTNSIYGKNNYRHGEMKRFLSCKEQENNIKYIIGR